jgi:hypothetical protein
MHTPHRRKQRRGGAGSGARNRTTVCGDPGEEAHGRPGALLLGQRRPALIDAGSTTQVFAGFLVGAPGLRVVTNALTVAGTLAAKDLLNCHTVGGRVRPSSLAGVGSLTQRVFDDLRFDVAFVGTNAAPFSRGGCTPDPEEAVIERAMIVGSAGRAPCRSHRCRPWLACRVRRDGRDRSGDHRRRDRGRAGCGTGRLRRGDGARMIVTVTRPRRSTGPGRWTRSPSRWRTGRRGPAVNRAGSRSTSPGRCTAAVRRRGRPSTRQGRTTAASGTRRAQVRGSSTASSTRAVMCASTSRCSPLVARRSPPSRHRPLR